MMGAGDVMMGFLGAVIISMGFRIYQQRETMVRHAPEIFGATILSSLFSFFSTAFFAKFLGLSAGRCRFRVKARVTRGVLYMHAWLSAWQSAGDRLVGWTAIT